MSAPARLIESPPVAPRQGRIVSGRQRLARTAGLTVFALLVVQALAVTHVRPSELVTGVHGLLDILRRSLPPRAPDWSTDLRALQETFDIALVGTIVAAILALPLALCAAENITPSRTAYVLARTVIAVSRVVPDLIWALFFVAAVGLGSFAGVLALSVHSIGMLGRLFAESIEDMDLGPVQALEVAGAGRLQRISHAVLPGVLPTLTGIALYRLDENVRSSLVLGFVGAGGIGFQILSAMQLFDYRTVSALIVMTFVLVVAVERTAALIRRRLS